MSALLKFRKLNETTPVLTAPPAVHDVRMTLSARQIVTSSSQAVLVEFAGDRREWVPRGAIKSVAPDPEHNGIVVEFDLDVVEARGLREFRYTPHRVDAH